MMAHGKTESRLTCAGQAAHLGADYSKKKVYYIILLYSIAYCDIGIAVNRIDYVNCLNNGVSLCLFILGVIIIDIINSGHFKRKK